jgi:hypothetical protein
MPDIARQEYHPFGITICGGTAHQNGAGDKGKGDKTQRNAPCPFSANMATAFSDAETGAIVPVYIFVALIALAAFVFSQARHNGNAAPRAPPLFS